MAPGVPLPASAHLLIEIGERMADPSDAIDDFTLRRWLEELDRAKKTVPRALRAILFQRIGACHAGLRDYSSALEAYKLCALYEPDEPGHENNIAITLGSLNRQREALDHIAMARAKGGTDKELLASLGGNEAVLLSELGDALAARRAFESAVGDIARECPRSYYTLAKNAASLGYKHDATELIARYLVGVGVATRDADETAEEVLLSHPDETRAIVGTVEHLADAVAETLADWDAPIPEEHEIRTHFTLEPDAWAQFCVRAGVTPES